MRVLLLLHTALAALNCSEFGLEEFDKQNVVSRVFDTPPLRTNKTVYFNPCAPLTGPKECGDDNHLCGIDAMEVDGKWETTAIKPFGSAAHGMFEESAITVDYGLVLLYYGATWGDIEELLQDVRFVCSNITSISIEPQSTITYDVTSVYVLTPRVCGLRSPRRRTSRRRRKSVWDIIGRITVAIFSLLVGYVAIALFVFSRSRRLGPLSEEIQSALREIPVLVREGFLNIYERVTGRGTGRNVI